MSTLQEIESKITELSNKELSLFRSWFEKFDSDEWDRKFENDVKSGKLDELANQAIADFHENRCNEL